MEEYKSAILASQNLNSMKYLKLVILTILITSVSLFDLTSQVESPFEQFYDATEWRAIGPFRGGRSCAVTGVPGKPNLFYFGSTGGGIWRTKDGGRYWENISDGYFGGSIGSIAVSESDNNVIYVGGGEKTVRGNVSSGYGVWKSEDAGKSWKSLGLDESRHISRIRIHPTDHNIVYAAVMGNIYKAHEERGVFKSTDGGETWQKSLYINDEVGIVDLCMDPNNPRILYASSWRVKRTPFSLESGGEGSGLWKSTDSGETWTEITGNKGLPEGIWGISGVAVSHTNSDRIYAIIENKDGGVFRSDDAGKTWTKTNTSRSLRQRAWYYTRIYADTQDEDAVYIVNVAYHKSTDGGKTFDRYVAPHGDHHDLWIAPENPKRMIIADDGGAQVSYDGGTTWSTYHNQNTAQFYRVTTDNAFPYRIYVAQQDNSTIRIAHRSSGSSINEDHWESTAGGESAHIAPDPKNPDIVYGGSYGGFLTRRDHDLNTRRAVNVWPDNPMGYGAEGMRYRFQWNFPIFFSKHDPNKLYAASNHLHVTTNEGQSWEIISPDLTRNDPEKLKSSGGPITKDNTGVEYYCTIFAAGESPVTEGIIWVGSDDGRVHVTRDGGSNWEDVTPSNMPTWLMVNSVEPHPTNPAGCYIAGTLYKEGDFKPYLYKTTNYGQSWEKIVNGIDEEHFTRVLRADPKMEGLLYAGTETGMYISHDDGQQWHPFQLNLPIVPITDLAIKDDNLIAATQGRGIWIIDDLTLIHQMNDAISDEQNHLFKPMASYRFPGRQNKNVKSAGINHPSGVIVNYFLQDHDDTDTVTLSFYQGDELIKKYSSKSKNKGEKLEVETGSNQFVWNMRYKDASSFDGMIMWSGSLAGPRAVPGEYSVELTVNDESKTQNFTILADPRLGISQEGYQSQFDFITEVNGLVSESHETIKDIREIKGQLKVYKGILKDHEDIVSEISAVDSILNSIETSLYQTKNQSRQDPLNFPIKLTNKLAHLNSLTQFSEGPPTDQAVAVKEELAGLIQEQLDSYQEILTERIPALNSLIRTQEVDYIILKE